MLRRSSQLSRGMRTSAFWVSGTTQLGCTITDDGYEGLIFRILIVLGLYYLSKCENTEADQVCDYRPRQLIWSLFLHMQRLGFLIKRLTMIKETLSQRINTGVIIPEFTVVTHYDRNRSLIDCSEQLCTLKKWC